MEHVLIVARVVGRLRIVAWLNSAASWPWARPSPPGHITLDIRVIIAGFFDPICGDDHPYHSIGVL
jgi:hypothetical protein